MSCLLLLVSGTLSNDWKIFQLVPEMFLKVSSGGVETSNTKHTVKTILKNIPVILFFIFILPFWFLIDSISINSGVKIIYSFTQTTRHTWLDLHLPIFIFNFIPFFLLVTSETKKKACRLFFFFHFRLANFPHTQTYTHWEHNIDFNFGLSHDDAIITAFEWIHSLG
jgi:hypothetical protein